MTKRSFFEVPAAGADDTPQANRENLEKNSSRPADGGRKSNECSTDEYHRCLIAEGH